MKRALWWMLLAAVAGTGWVMAAGTAAAPPRVTVSSGVIQGLRVADLPRGGAFLGIPYAAQPVGALRWQAPQPAPRWEGVRDASRYGPACPQAPSGWLPEMLGVEKIATDEACLTLNVWTPEMHPKAKLPVFVWVHGGGNVEGAGDWPPLGVTLAEQGMVVVSIEYRLGVFGFLASPLLDGESPHHASGNYGHLDQIAALRWVQQNIERFGGDPGAVTIGGQSSGALDVCNLMASPPAAGLFERAILQSGVCVDSVYPTLREAETSGARLQKDLGIAPGQGALQALRDLPAERVLEAAEADDDLDLEPVVDGWVLPQQPAIAFAQGKQARVAVLAGSNANEVSIFASPIVGGHSSGPKTVAEYRAWLQRKFGKYANGKLAEQVFREYPAASDSDSRRTFEQMDTDFDFGFGAWLLADETARAGQPAFLYDFTYAGGGKFAELGAFHSEECMFLSRKYWTSWVAEPEDAGLSRDMIGYWARFVKTGDPNGRGLPPWPAWKSEDGRAQELGQRIGPEAVPRVQGFGVFQDYLHYRLEKVTQ